MVFVNRVFELKHLEGEYSVPGAKFVVLYGRRRIGKTRLIEEFIKNKPSVYYLASQESDKQQIHEFKQLIAGFLEDDFLRHSSFSDWKLFFSYLVKVWPKDKKLVLAIDEVTYVIKANSSFPSYFQNFWDSFLSKSNTLVIFSGSMVNFLIQSVLSQDSPLYGRRTSQIFLTPFSFKESMLLMPKTSFENSVVFYSIVGGVAKYLLFIEEHDPTSFIKQKVFLPEGFFYQEGLFVFSQEFKEPSTYLSIIKAIAFGNSKLDTISNFAGLDTKTTSRYLDILISLGFVNKIIPVTENEKTFRGAVYAVSDNFLNFWNRFVYPNRDSIELRNQGLAFKKIKTSLNEFVARTFETICLQAVRELISEEKFSFTKIGRWWHKDIEIDLVGLKDDSKEILFGECKWRENVNADELLSKLIEKTHFVNWHSNDRKEFFILFAKSFKKKIHKENVFLYDLSDLESLFKKH